jgi:hypothetical protein
VQKQAKRKDERGKFSCKTIKCTLFHAKCLCYNEYNRFQDCFPDVLRRLHGIWPAMRGSTGCLCARGRAYDSSENRYRKIGFLEGDGFYLPENTFFGGWVKRAVICTVFFDDAGGRVIAARFGFSFVSAAF